MVLVLVLVLLLVDSNSVVGLSTFVGNMEVTGVIYCYKFQR